MRRRYALDDSCRIRGTGKICSISWVYKLYADMLEIANGKVAQSYEAHMSASQRNYTLLRRPCGFSLGIIRADHETVTWPEGFSVRNTAAFWRECERAV